MCIYVTSQTVMLCFLCLSVFGSTAFLSSTFFFRGVKCCKQGNARPCWLGSPLLSRWLLTNHQLMGISQLSLSGGNLSKRIFKPHFKISIYFKAFFLVGNTMVHALHVPTFHLTFETSFDELKKDLKVF